MEKSKIEASLKIAQFALMTLWRSLKLTQSVSFEKNPVATETVLKWSQDVCRIFNVRLHVTGEPLLKEGGLLIGNHMSYLDIPVMCSLEPINFVAKSEVMSWPIIGRVGKAIGNIYHNRTDPKAKRSTAELIKDAVINESRRVCVYPEGTTSLYGLPWRQGVFKLAHEIQCPVQVFSLCYRPANVVAFQVGTTLEHALQLNSQGPIDAYLHLGPVVKISDPEKDFEHWMQWNKQHLWAELAKQNISAPEPLTGEIAQPFQL